VILYVTPFVSPVIVTGEDVSTGENAMKAPPLSEYL
jgi:hypothetical protein